MRPASAKLKHDLYARQFEMQDLARELTSMKFEYKKKKARYDFLKKQQEAQDERDRKELQRKSGKY